MIQLTSTPALLIIDKQNGFCHKDGTFAKLGFDVTPLKEVVPAIDRSIDRGPSVANGTSRYITRRWVEVPTTQMVVSCFLHQ
jgi:nicotinamidase-related amidase